MELRPGYKKTEIGVIPEDWDVKPLSAVVEGLSAGVSVNSSDNTSDSAQGEKGILKTSAVFDGRFDPSERKVIAMRDLGRARLSPKQDAILISRMNTPDLVGECGYVETDMPDLFIPDRIWMTVYRGDVELSKRWLALLLSSKPIKTRIKGIATGTSGSMKNIAKEAMLGFLLPFPSCPEQKVIAEALSDVDASIAALSRLIAKKHNLRQGTMQRLLTGQTRLPGFTAPWQEKRLGDHVTFLKNGVQSRAQLTHDDTVRYLHYGDIHVSANVCLDLRDTEMPRLSFKAAAGLTRLQDGDVVFVDASEDLNGVGKSLEVTGAHGIEAVSGQHTIAARFDKTVLADGYKCYLQFMPSFTAHLRRLAAGTKVYATNRKHVASAELRLPEADEQIAIAQVLSDMNAEIAALETRLDKTRALKQAMMQALLTGRVRLPVRRDAAPQTKEAVDV